MIIKKKKKAPGQVGIERSVSDVLEKEVKKQMKDKKFVDAEVLQSAKEFGAIQEEASRFTNEFLATRKRVESYETEDLKIKTLLEGNQKSAKIAVLTRLNILKEDGGAFREKTVKEILKTIVDTPREYAKRNEEGLRIILNITMRKNLERIPAYEHLSQEGKGKLVEILARHKDFNKIISEDNTKSYWIKKIIEEREDIK